MDRFYRSIKNIAREYLPTTPHGHENFSVDFLFMAGMVFNGLSGMVKDNESWLRHYVKCTAGSIADEVKNSSETSDYLMSLVGEDLGSNTHGTKERHISDLLQASFGGTSDYQYRTPPLSGEKRVTTLDGSWFSKKLSPSNRDADSTDSLAALGSWSLVNRNLIFIDPATAMMLHETEFVGTIDVSQVAKKWPSVVLHDSFSGTTMLCHCNTKDDSLGSAIDIATAESIHEVEFDSLNIDIYNGSGTILRTVFKDGVVLDKGCVQRGLKEEKAKQQGGGDANISMRILAFFMNAFTMATSYPTYIDVGESKTWHKKFRKSSVVPSVLTAKIPARSLIQIVRDKTAENSLSGTGVSVRPHWRQGHWRRQYHGITWELENPDVTVYEDDEGRRYHLKYIAAVLVNQAAFIGEHKGE
tara:strand:- start:2382 stop:3623 length:1242 start_codon:yes stop_codon:yes gene_type:complete